MIRLKNNVVLVPVTILNDSQINKLSLAMILIKIVQIKRSWERCILGTDILIKSSTWTLIIRKIAILHHLSFLSYTVENGNIKNRNSIFQKLLIFGDIFYAYFGHVHSYPTSPDRYLAGHLVPFVLLPILAFLRHPVPHTQNLKNDTTHLGYHARIPKDIRRIEVKRRINTDVCLG